MKIITFKDSGEPKLMTLEGPCDFLCHNSSAGNNNIVVLETKPLNHQYTECKVKCIKCGSAAKVTLKLKSTES
jgi:hypothetical protein